MDRRQFLAGSAAAAAALAVGVLPARAESPRRALRILILGGTGFIGPHQVAAARARGHALTLFNRGQSNPGLFPDIEQLRGDRNGDLTALEGRRWDAVIDNSAFEPAQMRLSANLLKDAVGQYLFVSTQSVYASRAIVGQDETGAVGNSELPEQEWTGYGPLKALCEKELRAAIPERHTIVRPPVIVGPGDASDRFTYWVQRVAAGGEILAPGRPEDPTQYIDVRDLCDWIVRLVEDRTFGTFNATGPAEPLTVSRMLDEMRAESGSDARFVWTSYAFLADQKVRPFSDLPMWMVPEGRTAGFMRMNNARARAAGLTFRPLRETVRDTLDWHRSRPAEDRAELRAGLKPDREAEVIAAWKRSGS